MAFWGEMKPQLSILVPPGSFTKDLLLSPPSSLFLGRLFAKQNMFFPPPPPYMRQANGHSSPFFKYVIHTILSQLIAPSIVHNLSLSRFFTFYFLLMCFLRNLCFYYVALDFISINCMISNKYIYMYHTRVHVFFKEQDVILLVGFSSYPYGLFLFH